MAGSTWISAKILVNSTESKQIMVMALSFSASIELDLHCILCTYGLGRVLPHTQEGNETDKVMAYLGITRQ